MHLGHSMVIEQVKWFQQQGADVTVAVADLEALATRESASQMDVKPQLKNTY